jgi:N-glycosidase YbiA
MSICEGIKKDGARCSNKAKTEVGGKFYCGIHEKGALAKSGNTASAAAASSTSKAATKVYEPPQTSNVIKFQNIQSDSFSCFGNSYEYNFKYRDMEWPTVEHAFQALKFYHGKSNTTFETFMKIKNAPSAQVAKQISLSASDVRGDWNDLDGEYTVKDLFMFEILEAKFRGPLKQKLLSTSGKELQFVDSQDSYWGIGYDGEGRNMLGILLMQLRDRL